MKVTSKGNNDFNPVSAGLHPAICVWQIDLGSRHNEKYNRWQRKVMLTWEVVDERIDTDKGNKPRVISKTYTASISDKGDLRKDLVSWRSKDFTPEEKENFDLATAVGKPCQINVVHVPKGDKVYANVSIVLPYKGPAMKPENPLIVYDIETHGTNIPPDVPEWIVKQIKECPEYKALENASDAGFEFDGSQETPADTGDNIPF
jgi:hypothetical protein